MEGSRDERGKWGEEKVGREKVGRGRKEGGNVGGGQNKMSVRRLQGHHHK